MNKVRAKEIIEEMYDYWKANHMTFQEMKALELAKEALEKQTGKDVIPSSGDDFYYICPTCGENELEQGCEDYCPKCGQKLKY